MKEFVLKENEGYRLKVKSWKCLRPNDLNTIEFIQELKDKDGNVSGDSTYQFFMTDDEIKLLSERLVA